MDKYINLSNEVHGAIGSGIPIVALESTVITHGLPYPENLHLAREMESEVRQLGVVPATIAVIEGMIRVGLNERELEHLASASDIHKISMRELSSAIVCKWSGGTTVAGTIVIARRAGIKVFATGGIGGVHRNAPFDISADLTELSRNQVVVVCSGAKAILDLSATIEKLETLSVPIVGYQTDQFPAFYSSSSGLPVTCRVNQPQEIVAIARSHWGLGLESSVLIANPPPDEVALSSEIVDRAINQALQEAERENIRGQAVSPFLLKRVSKITRGDSLKTNLALLKNNARLAARIALAWDM